MRTSNEEPEEPRFPPTPASDDELMVRVQAGDVDAFAELAGRYRGPLRRFFAALPGGEARLADDFAQETLLRLYLSRARWRPSGSFSAYLFQIARHYYLNQRSSLRERGRRELSLGASHSGDGVEIAVPTRTQPERVLLEGLERERRRQAISDLPEHLRAVFVLSHFEGLRYREIASQLGIPDGTVKSRMAEAVRRLRAALGEPDEPSERWQGEGNHEH